MKPKKAELSEMTYAELSEMTYADFVAMLNEKMERTVRRILEQEPYKSKLKELSKTPGFRERLSEALKNSS